METTSLLKADQEQKELLIHDEHAKFDYFFSSIFSGFGFEWDFLALFI